MKPIWEMIKMIRAVKIFAILAILIAPWMVDWSKSASVAADSSAPPTATLTGNTEALAPVCSLDTIDKVTFVSNREIRRQRFFGQNRPGWRWERFDDWTLDTQEQDSNNWEIARMFFHVIFDNNDHMLSAAIRQINSRFMLSGLSNS